MSGKDLSLLSEDYRRIAKAIDFLENNFRERPTLDRIASGVHLSKFHFTRLFKRWAGISPMQFMHFLTLEYTKGRLKESGNLLDVSLDAGLSGPGRLHDLFVTFEAMTPGEFKQQGAGLTIEFGFHPTPFGECLLARTGRGIAHLGFVDDEDRKTALDNLQELWPRAALVENPIPGKPVIKRIFDRTDTGESRPFHLLLKGTNFQINVWKALLGIPRGTVVSYRDVAALIGRPRAFRAVGNAIAVNPVGYLIPCHRVIARSGRIHRYRWGTARKKALLAHEAAEISLIESA